MVGWPVFSVRDSCLLDMSPERRLKSSLVPMFIKPCLLAAKSSLLLCELSEL